MATPVFVFQRGLVGVRGPIQKAKSPGCNRTISWVELMFTNDNTTTSKTVKIFAPFKLNATQRMVLADGKLLNIAAPNGRQQGEYLYSATVTLLREDSAVYTTAPSWASVEIR